MGRRTIALLLVAVSATSALTSCSTDGNGDARPGGPPATTTAAPVPSTSRAPSQTAPGQTAQSQSATPPATRGTAPTRTFAVKVRKLQLSRGKDRPLPTTLWYPATGQGPFPVIVFSHGLTAHPTDYSPILTRWARAGFVVAGPAYPHTSTGVPDFDVADLINQPADASYVLTKVLALGDKPGDSLRGRLDRQHVAAAGHSGGGITTIGMLTGSRDDRLTAALVLAGRQVLPGTFTGPAAPVFFVHGKLDRTVPYADGLAAFDAVPWPKAMLTLPDGGHLVDRGRGFDLVAGATTDFWRWSLYGDTAARRRLEARKNLDSDL